MKYRLQSKNTLNQHVQQLILAPVGEVLTFQAGQYLTIQTPGDEWQPYSIASAPRQDGCLELHIYRNDYTAVLLDTLFEDGDIIVDGPFGDCHWQRVSTSPQPLVLIAGGTGIAPFLALIEQAVSVQYAGKLYLLWGARQRDDLYALDQVQEMLAKLPNATLQLCLSQADSDSSFTSGRIDTLITQTQLPLDSQVLLSGSPQMVFAAVDALAEQGITREQCDADVFAYFS